MRLREKGKTNGEVVTLGWDEAQAALQAGTHEVAETEGAGAGPAPNAPKPDEKGDDFDNLSRADLAALAGERGLEVSASATKSDIVKALRAPR